MKRTRPLRVLFLAAEAAPLAAAGGLADVVGSLPKSLAQIGVDARVLMPRYTSIDAKKYRVRDTRVRVPITFDGIRHVVRVFATTLPNSRVPVYLADHPHYEGTGHVYYQDVTNSDEQRALQAERFLFLTASSALLLCQIGWTPDVVHFHDWHTSAAPLFFPCPTVATIHNLALQGSISTRRLRELLGDNIVRAVPKGALRSSTVNLTRLGLIRASAITTVSPTYAKEILHKTSGVGCDDILRKRRHVVSGILNGIDTTTYDPQHDAHIFPYQPATLGRKKRNTDKLRHLFKLKKTGPVFCVVSRLTEQKGIELICSSVPQLVQWKANLVVLGTGTPEHERMVQRAARRFPKAVGVRIAFDSPLAHQIYAGSDAFLMPSRFEPCGLGQMIALRYGTIPIVRATGGLADTVHEGPKGNGFTFKPSTCTALVAACKRFLKLFATPASFRELQQRAMGADVSWNASARQYKTLYQHVTRT